MKLDEAPSSGFTSLAAPRFTAEHSYLLYPASLQSLLLPSGIEAPLLATVQSTLLPGSLSPSAVAINTATAPTNCTSIQLFSDQARSQSSVHEAEFLPASRLGLKPANTAIDGAELLYSLAWQAIAPASSAPLFPSRSAALLRRSADHYQGDESLAGAEVARLLAHHRETLPSNELTMVSSSAVPVLAVPGHVSDHVAAAFVSGVLKNLPYELPAVKLQAFDQDAAFAAGAGATPGSFAFTAAHAAPSAAWGASDMYGAVSAAGMVLRPLLSYSKTTSATRTVGSAALSQGSTTPALHSKISTIITGGLGGLGSMTATWAAGSGAGALVLLGRSGCLPAGSWSGINGLLHSQALVVMAKADASFSEDADNAVSMAASTDLPLGSVFHAAGIQIEARLLKQTPTTMRQTAAPKLAAFRKCHGAAPGAPVAANLLFSSVSSVTGNANHANYAGANAALDALAEQHASQGSGVVAVQWGAWASVGTF